MGGGYRCRIGDRLNPGEGLLHGHEMRRILRRHVGKSEHHAVGLDASGDGQYDRLYPMTRLDYAQFPTASQCTDLC